LKYPFRVSHNGARTMYWLKDLRASSS
jgi:hypothetical protein